MHASNCLCALKLLLFLLAVRFCGASRILHFARVDEALGTPVIVSRCFLIALAVLLLLLGRRCRFAGRCHGHIRAAQRRASSSPTPAPTAAATPSARMG